MEDLRGSASQRLAQLGEARATGEATEEWLSRQLLTALREIDALEALADADRDRREDY